MVISIYCLLLAYLINSLFKYLDKLRNIPPSKNKELLFEEDLHKGKELEKQSAKVSQRDPIENIKIQSKLPFKVMMTLEY